MCTIVCYDDPQCAAPRHEVCIEKGCYLFRPLTCCGTLYHIWNASYDVAVQRVWIIVLT